MGMKSKEEVTDKQFPRNCAKLSIMKMINCIFIDIRRYVAAYIRRMKLRKSNPSVMICSGTEFVFPENINFAGNICIGIDCYFHSAGGIDIGQGSCIAGRVTILSENHRCDDP